MNVSGVVVLLHSGAVVSTVLCFWNGLAAPSEREGGNLIYGSARGSGN